MAGTNAPPPPDPIALAQALIRCPSVTPEDGGVLGVLEAALRPLGFRCERMPFTEEGTADVDNLYARVGTEGPNFCFGGHTDVVPVGDRDAWSHDPFGAEIDDGMLHGRGASDMKGAVAAFAAATARFLAERGPDFGGSISMLITNDEEGPSINGTRKVLDALAARGEALDACLVGEPTNPEALGDMIKIGRRGNLDGHITVHGKQGHTAYPHLADNPVHHLAAMLSALADEPIDEGTEHFQPTILQITTVDVGNPAMNVIPATARAAFNSRFNDLHTPQSLEALLRARLDRVAGERGAKYVLTTRSNATSFLTPPGALSDLLAGAIEAHCGRRPALTTTGGTSDARFFKDHCPVVEFGLVGQTMHQVDERVPAREIEALAAIYKTVLDGYFAGP